MNIETIKALYTIWMVTYNISVWADFGYNAAGVEARGFIFGPPIALALGAKFVPMRKPNKLPGSSFLWFFVTFVGKFI